jgi:hypothetical protein
MWFVDTVGDLKSNRTAALPNRFLYRCTVPNNASISSAARAAPPALRSVAPILFAAILNGGSESSLAVVLATHMLGASFASCQATFS